MNEQTSEILANKLVGSDLIWFFDIEARACKQIVRPCLASSNQNFFENASKCKSQCIPNVNEEPTQGNSFFN